MLNLTATLETRISKKNNTEYKVLVVQFPDGYKKNVFLDEAELKLLELSQKREEDVWGNMPDLDKKK